MSKFDFYNDYIPESDPDDFKEDHSFYLNDTINYTLEKIAEFFFLSEEIEESATPKNFLEKSNFEEISSLSKETVEFFLGFDQNLKIALNEASDKYQKLKNEYPELVNYSEKDLINYLRENILNFYPLSSASPYVPLAAKGPWIITFHGGVIYDTGGYGMIGLGHNPDVVLESIGKEQVMANIMTASFSHKEIVTALQDNIGYGRKCPFTHFCFLNSGSEAVSFAARISDARAGKKKFKSAKYITLKNSFHGRTYLPAKASGSSQKKYSVLASFKNGNEKCIEVEPNNIEELRAAFEYAKKENIFIEMMLMEPVMGEGRAGFSISKEFYAEARKLTLEHDSLLLIDSIQAGLRCQGVLSIVDYPGFELLDAPDIETYSKAINGGQFPLSVLAMTERASKAYQSGIYGNSMTGNPRAMDLAVSVLGTFNKEKRNNIISQGEYFRGRLDDLKLIYPDIIEEVTSTGLLLATKINSKYNVDGFDGLEQAIRKQGVNVIHGSGNRLRFTPWFGINNAETDLIIEILRITFDELGSKKKVIRKVDDYNKFVKDKTNTKKLKSYSPINNEKIGVVSVSTEENYEDTINELKAGFVKWKAHPAPKRALIVKEIGEEIKKQKAYLGRLITLETGKLLEEGKGEIQEVIDIIDYAVGLSRLPLGGIMKSEREDHRLFEQWHPLGIVGIITAFNFPVAVWGWNAMLATVLGNVILWKPSEQTPLVSIAVNNIAKRVTEKHGFSGVFELVIDKDASLGKKMAKDKNIALVSATGSTSMGKQVAKTVSERLGKSLLELGGNNAVIIMDDADLDLAIPSVVFGAVGTCGQRCTTTRRLLVHKKLFKKVEEKLINAYSQLNIGDPLDKNTHVGPLINEKAVTAFNEAIKTIKKQGGKILYGGKTIKKMPSNFYVEPTLVKADSSMEIIKAETFAPILYIMEIESLDEAIELNNAVPQGLSSAIFSNNIRNTEKFISNLGSDCGIANINLGTSGAEIGGAFGGEKETGGGRESGSDAWKNYARRMTTTINYGNSMPLAQGIKFKID
jgi:aldehyde dehydrogenase (NAD+)